MRRLVRIGLTAGALSLGLLLAACENFDPTAIFDAEMFNTKKKLPGERRPVFPEGTPGVSQGVPSELVKGYQAPAGPEAASKEASKEAPKEASKEAPKQATAEPTDPKPKPKPKPKLVAKPESTPTAVTVRPTQPSAQQSPSPQAPSPQAPSPQAPSPQAQWPDPPLAQQAPVASRWPDSPQPSGGVAWPDPPAPR
jgi:hypothetical protein